MDLAGKFSKNDLRNLKGALVRYANRTGRITFWTMIPVSLEAAMDGAVPDRIASICVAWDDTPDTPSAMYKGSLDRFELLARDTGLEV